MIVWLVAGCVTGFKLDKDPTCSEEPYDWGAGLTTHLVNGKKDGTFDYDPDGPLLDRVEGSYDLETGDFSWLASYPTGARRTTDNVQGFGTAWTDGNLDVDMEVDSAGTGLVGATTGVRDVRLGCDIDRTVTDPNGDVRVYEGTFEHGALSYTHTYADHGRVLTAAGTLEQDGSWEEEVAYDVTGVTRTSTETGTSDGDVSRTYNETSADEVVDGSWTRAADGTLDAGTVVDPVGEGLKETWTYTIDAHGTGSGDLQVGPQDKHCELVFAFSGCSQVNCVELTDGPCEVLDPAPDWLVRL